MAFFPPCCLHACLLNDASSSVILHHLTPNLSYTQSNDGIEVRFCMHSAPQRQEEHQQQLQVFITPYLRMDRHMVENTQNDL